MGWGWAGLMHRILENMSAEPGFKSTEIFLYRAFHVIKCILLA